MVNAGGLIIAAPASGQGKTLITLGLLRALKNRGVAVASAKVGPDYIDPAFHMAASGRPCLNMDPWAMSRGQLAWSASDLSIDSDLIICEGVMGLFDGATTKVGSTADLAAETGWPVILVVAAQSVACSAAAIVQGFNSHRPGIKISGVIFNRVGSDRHASILKEAMADTLPDIPVVGCLRRGPDLHIPNRHLGLVQASEHQALDDLLEAAAHAVAKDVDLDHLSEIAKPSRFLKSEIDHNPAIPPPGQRIAVARDKAFGFCYPHVLQGWAEAGASLSLFSPLNDEAPDNDADVVYLPGGYPELHAGTLSEAKTFLLGLHRAAASGKSVFGECGGYMVLGDRLIDANGESFPMAGLLPVTTSFRSAKLHLGYRHATLVADCILGSAGECFSAHEFHYASVVAEEKSQPLFDCVSAEGKDLGVAGIRSGTVAGSFMHLITKRPSS